MHGEREGVYTEGVECACMGRCVCIWKGRVRALGEGGVCIWKVECACMGNGGCVHMEAVECACMWRRVCIWKGWSVRAW